MDGVTGVVIGTILALISIITVFVKASVNRSRCDTENLLAQQELQLGLANIRKELIELKLLTNAILDKDNEVGKTLAQFDKRITLLEKQKLK